MLFASPMILDRFYAAVRGHLPLAVLEGKIVFDWKTEEENRTLLPADVLIEDIRHDHVAYARYLLKYFAETCLNYAVISLQTNISLSGCILQQEEDNFVDS